MYLFRKKDIVNRIADYSTKFEIESGKPPTDIVLNKEELKEVYDYFKGGVHSSVNLIINNRT